jgi:hypothetical protein
MTVELQSEYQRIEIISGIFRPTRSASQPEAHAPTIRAIPNRGAGHR